MQVTCKHCQSVLQVDSKNHGKKTRCGNCKQAFVIVDPKQVADAKKAKQVADAKAKKESRLAEAKAWEESIKPMPALPKREFKKKPIANSPMVKAVNFKIHGERRFTRFILGSAETFLQVVFWIVTVGYILLFGFSFFGFLFSAGNMPEELREIAIGIQITFWVTTAVSYLVFFVLYVLAATPILALVCIERNTRMEGN